MLVLHQKLCAVDGGWNDVTWSSECSEYCSGGTRRWSRECNNPPVSGGGKDCTGEKSGTEDCNTEPCPCSFSRNQKVVDGVRLNLTDLSAMETPLHCAENCQNTEDCTLFEYKTDACLHYKNGSLSKYEMNCSDECVSGVCEQRNTKTDSVIGGLGALILFGCCLIWLYKKLGKKKLTESLSIRTGRKVGNKESAKHEEADPEEIIGFYKNANLNQSITSKIADQQDFIVKEFKYIEEKVKQSVPFTSDIAQKPLNSRHNRYKDMGRTVLLRLVTPTK